MKEILKIGTIGQQTFVVAPQHAIDFADEKMPAVLSTLWLIWFLEHAARAAVLPYLEPGESTVGVIVEVRHLAATPIGEQVTCTARVVHQEKSLISFQLEAADEHDVICRGFHKLRVIRVDRFAARLRGRSPGTKNS